MADGNVVGVQPHRLLPERQDFFPAFLQYIAAGLRGCEHGLFP
jgi:hypothetical protein